MEIGTYDDRRMQKTPMAGSMVSANACWVHLPIKRARVHQIDALYYNSQISPYHCCLINNTEQGACRQAGMVLTEFRVSPFVGTEEQGICRAEHIIIFIPAQSFLFSLPLPFSKLDYYRAGYYWNWSILIGKLAVRAREQPWTHTIILRKGKGKMKNMSIFSFHLEFTQMYSYLLAPYCHIIIAWKGTHRIGLFLSKNTYGDTTTNNFTPGVLLPFKLETHSK